MTACVSFPAVARSDARVLLLGSMPGRASLDAGEYYAHPANLFWSFMQELLGVTAIAYVDRVTLLLKNQIALWDVAGYCERDGSLDSAISINSVIANDFPALFLRCPDIQTVCFNGLKAQQLYRRLVRQLPAMQRFSPEYILLPSTSPANASFSRLEKFERWMAIKRFIV